MVVREMAQQVKERQLLPSLMISMCSLDAMLQKERTNFRKYPLTSMWGHTHAHIHRHICAHMPTNPHIQKIRKKCENLLKSKQNIVSSKISEFSGAGGGGEGGKTMKMRGLVRWLSRQRELPQNQVTRV